MINKPPRSWLHGGSVTDCSAPILVGFRILATTWLTTVLFVLLWRGGTRRLRVSTFRLGDDSNTWWCVLFATSPHWWHVSIPRDYHMGRRGGVDGDALGVLSGWSSCWGDLYKRCTLSIWLLEEDFQRAYVGAVGVGDWAWCDSRGAKDAGPGCPHIFVILDGDHALHWQEPKWCGCCLPKVP